MRNIAILALAALVVAVNGSSNLRVQMEAEVEAHNEKKSSWTFSHKPSRKEMMRLTVAIRVDDDVVQKLEKELYEVSDPKHARYGQHKTVNEITAFLDIPTERYTRVVRWFKDSGVKTAELNPNKDMITIEAPVDVVENILSTKIHAFVHKEHKDKIILRAAQPYFLPATIAKDVFMVGEVSTSPN